MIAASVASMRSLMLPSIFRIFWKSALLYARSALRASSSLAAESAFSFSAATSGSSAALRLASANLLRSAASGSPSSAEVQESI
jgi:hypothetical protein